MSRASILFFGNPLHGDDGFGPAVFERLARSKSDIAAALVYVETASLGALNHFADCDEAVLVDAIHCEEPICFGQVAELTPAELCETGNAYSTHCVGLPFLMRAIPIAFGDKAPRIRILGAFGERPTIFRMGLSPAMERAVPVATRWLREQYGNGQILERERLSQARL